MSERFDALAGMTPAERAATEAYVAKLIAAAPEPTPELLARLRPILAPPPAEESGAA